MKKLKKAKKIVAVKAEPQVENANLVDLRPTIFEPKTTSRWICYILDEDEKELIPPYVIRGFQRPALYRKPSEYVDTKWYPVSPNMARSVRNNSLSVPKNELSVGEISIAMYDPVSPSTSQILYELINKNKVVNVKLILLGPVGDKVEEWVYKNCHITNVTFGFLNWGSNVDPSLLYAKLSPKYATVQ